MVGLVRGSGIGLDFSLLSTNGLASGVPSNCATKIMGRCGSAADYTAAGHSMGLTAEQIEWCKLNLKPGTFVGQLGEGDWRYPFIFGVPQMKFPAVGIDKSDDLSLGRLESLPTAFAEEFCNWGEPLEVPPAPESTQQTADPATSSEPILGVAEYRFLRAVNESPMQPCSGYAKLAKVGQKTAKAIRSQLTEAGYLREHIVQTKGRGRNSILLEITETGKDVIVNHESQGKNHV